MITRILVGAVLALTLTGCALGTGFGLSPEQLAALSKIKDANATCVRAHATLYGDLTITTVSVDKGIYGQTTISKDCETSVITVPSLDQQPLNADLFASGGRILAGNTEANSPYHFGSLLTETQAVHLYCSANTFSLFLPRWRWTT
jgi:hypothetical protein